MKDFLIGILMGSIMLVMGMIASDAHAVVLCNWYDPAGDAQSFSWYVGEPFPPEQERAGLNATDELGASCMVSGEELTYIQKNFTGLRSRKQPRTNPGQLFYSGGDALFIISNL